MLCFFFHFRKNRSCRDSKKQLVMHRGSCGRLYSSIWARGILSKLCFDLESIHNISSLLGITYSQIVPLLRRGDLEQSNVAWEWVWLKYAVFAPKQMSAFLIFIYAHTRKIDFRHNTPLLYSRYTS